MSSTNLQSELGKRRPFDVPEQEAGLNIIRTADQLGLVFARLFREYGLSRPLYNILRILRGVGGDGLPSLEIARQMITCVPDITRLVDRLEKLGLVRRVRCERDRRVVRVRVTDKALELLARLDEPVMELHRRLLGHLSREELETINTLMVKARHPE